jgi:hypothetical protein
MKKLLLIFLLCSTSLFGQLKPLPDSVIITALKAVDSAFGYDMAVNVERLFRNETNHFRSQNFLRTKCPGMEISRRDTILPYGWISCADLWKSHKQFAPIGLFRQKENNSLLAKAEGIQTFLVFPSVKACMMTVAWHLHKADPTHKNPGVWFARDKVLQNKYSDYLLGIYPRFCVQTLKEH